MWYIQTIDYSALTRNEILTYATMWVNLEDIIMLSEISQKQKDKYYIFLFTCNTWNSQIYRDNKSNTGEQSLGGWATLNYHLMRTEP
jgi:hypothetical protein